MSCPECAKGANAFFRAVERENAVRRKLMAAKHEAYHWRAAFSVSAVVIVLLGVLLICVAVD